MAQFAKIPPNQTPPCKGGSDGSDGEEGNMGEGGAGNGFDVSTIPLKSFSIT